ncbi:hypothetical protein BH10PSE9_BH10PSE9_21810 [soil metagenome]
MKLLTASAFAVVMTASVGGAFACEDYEQMAMETYMPPVAQTVAPDVRQMVMNYLEEIAAEQRIA